MYITPKDHKRMPPYFSSDELARWKTNGALVQPGLYNSEEMARIINLTNELEGLPEVPGLYMKHFENSLINPGCFILNRIENVYDYHQEFRELFGGEKVIGRVSRLFGEPAVLFKDKINFKKSGSGGFKAHQDQQAGWGHYARQFISVMIAIDEATAENGCLEVAPGHHKRGLIGKDWTPLTEQDLNGIKMFSCVANPGDAIFFDSFVPHRSAPNLSGNQRRALYLTYNRLSEGKHRTRYFADKRANYPPDCERQPGREYVYRV